MQIFCIFYNNTIFFIQKLLENLHKNELHILFHSSLIHIFDFLIWSEQQRLTKIKFYYESINNFFKVLWLIKVKIKIIFRKRNERE